MKIDPSAPAMPSSFAVPEIFHHEGHTTPAYTHLNPGLTIRAHFAAMAMQGMMASSLTLAVLSKDDDHKKAIAELADMCVVVADSLIEALNK